MPGIEAIESRRSEPEPKQQALVTVIIPTFNSSKTIARALRSVRAQTYQNLDIVIADDASCDDTQQRVDDFRDPRVTFLPSQEKTNKGPAVARNRGLAQARGTYVAFLDSDDEWLPDKLRTQVDYLETHPACSIVVSNAKDISAEGIVVGEEFDPPNIPASGAEAWRVLLKYSFIETSSVMTRRSLADELGGFDPNLFVSQDQDMWIRLATRGDVGLIYEIQGHIYKLSTSHMKRNRRREADIMLPMIERHVRRLGQRLSKREIDDILGKRYQVIGRSMFLYREYRLGVHLLAKASARNGNWIGNFFYVCHANPAAIWLKAIIRASRARLMGSPHGSGPRERSSLGSAFDGAGGT